MRTSFGKAVRREEIKGRIAAFVTVISMVTGFMLTDVFGAIITLIVGSVSFIFISVLYDEDSIQFRVSMRQKHREDRPL